jgi:hypothetical protein
MPSVALSFRSILAGTLVSILCYATLMLLFLTIGVRGNVVTQIWFVGSAVLALYAGAYFAGRASINVFVPQGIMQGLVIASLFFLSLFLLGGGAGRSAHVDVLGMEGFVTSSPVVGFLASRLLATLVLGSLLAALGGRDGVVASARLLEKARPERPEKVARAA